MKVNNTNECYFNAANFSKAEIDYFIGKYNEEDSVARKVADCLFNTIYNDRQICCFKNLLTDSYILSQKEEVFFIIEFLLKLSISEGDNLEYGFGSLMQHVIKDSNPMKKGMAKEDLGNFIFSTLLDVFIGRWSVDELKNAGIIDDKEVDSLIHIARKYITTYEYLAIAEIKESERSEFIAKQVNDITWSTFDILVILDTFYDEAAVADDSNEDTGYRLYENRINFAAFNWFFKLLTFFHTFTTVNKSKVDANIKEKEGGSSHVIKGESELKGESKNESKEGEREKGSNDGGKGNEEKGEREKGSNDGGNESNGKGDKSKNAFYQLLSIIHGINNRSGYVLDLLQLIKLRLNYDKYFIEGEFLILFLAMQEVEISRKFALFNFTWNDELFNITSNNELVDFMVNFDEFSRKTQSDFSYFHKLCILLKLTKGIDKYYGTSSCSKKKGKGEKKEEEVVEEDLYKTVVNLRLTNNEEEKDTFSGEKDEDVSSNEEEDDSDSEEQIDISLIFNRCPLEFDRNFRKFAKFIQLIANLKYFINYKLKVFNNKSILKHEMSFVNFINFEDLNYNDRLQQFKHATFGSSVDFDSRMLLLITSTYDEFTRNIQELLNCSITFNELQEKKKESCLATSSRIAKEFSEAKNLLQSCLIKSTTNNNDKECSNTDSAVDNVNLNFITYFITFVGIRLVEKFLSKITSISEIKFFAKDSLIKSIENFSKIVSLRQLITTKVDNFNDKLQGDKERGKRMDTSAVDATRLLTYLDEFMN